VSELLKNDWKIERERKKVCLLYCEDHTKVETI
jgi:hypothetical protein